MAGHDPNCDLCKLETKTKVYHEDDICIIVDCISCEVPMVIWKQHGVQEQGPNDNQMTHMFDQLGKLGEGDFILDSTRRLIPDHWHAHLRSKGNDPGGDRGDGLPSGVNNPDDSGRSLPHLGSVPIEDFEQESSDNESS